MKRRVLTKRRLFVGVLFFPGMFGLYLLLLIFPDPCFAYAYRQGRIVIRSDEPIPASAGSVLHEVEGRLATSVLPRASRDCRIYICNRPWRFVLFANFRYGVGGLTYPPLSNNIFLRGVDFDDNRLKGPSGIKVPGERTLSYFIAHEIVHTMIADRIGAFAYCQLPKWKDDGYCDYVAKGRFFSYDDALVRFRRGDPELDPALSGLYLRYHLLVAHLLDKRGKSVPELLKGSFDPIVIEHELLAPEGPRRPFP